MRPRSVSRLLLALILGACAREPGAPLQRAAPPRAASVAGRGDSAETRRRRSATSVDDRQAVVDATLKQVAQARQLAPIGPVRSEVIGRAALLDRMKKELAADLQPELLQGSTELLFALGAAAADLDYLGSSLELLGTQLAGFYDPRAKELVLLDDLGMEAQQVTLWHELVHGLQDQHYDLERLMKWQAGRGDALAAVQSLAEGDATSGMMDLMLLPRGQTALDVPEGMLSGSLAMMEAMPEIATVPRILKRSIVAPYVDGLAFVNALRRTGGWAAVDAAWRDLPATSEQILHPEKYRAHELGATVPLPAPPPSGPDLLIYHDVLGEQALRLALEEWVPRVTATESAAGWGGDAVAVFAAGDRRAVALHVRYDDENRARQGFESVARGALAPEPEGAASDRAGPNVSAAQAAAAVRQRQVCQVRHHRGPFAAVWRGRDLGVALGPYQRSGSVTHAVGDCAAALVWAENVARSH